MEQSLLEDKPKSLPSIKIFNSKIKMIHQLVTMIAKSDNKLKAHNIKWGKYKDNETDIESRAVAALC